MNSIVLFLTDDHARWALPVYGNPVVEMPNLEFLAARGTVYEDAYTTSPVCSPARASLMTGKMPSGHGLHDFLASHPDFDEKPWLESLPTLAEKLSDAGYQCAYAGKWHVGRDATPQSGFEYWYALNGEYPIHHDGDNGMSINGVEERCEGNLTNVITDYASRFLTQRDRAKPFCLIVGYYATHSPWTDQPERLVARYADHDFAEIDTGDDPAPGLLNVEMPDLSSEAMHHARTNYYAACTHIDEGIGTILDLLSAQGVLDETLVCYTADHGLSLGQRGVWGKGNATRPQNVFDDNIRVPLIMAGPGVEKGERSAGFVDHTDTHRRLLAATRQDAVPEFPPKRDIQFCEYGTLRMARTATHKLVTWTTGASPELYEVGPERDETRPVTQEPGADRLIASLQARIEEFFAEASVPSRTGPDQLLPGTFNYNQAWHAFVRRQQ